MELDFLLHCLSGKQQLSFRAQVILGPGFDLIHVDHWQPILHLVALQSINADTGFFQAMLDMTFSIGPSHNECILRAFISFVFRSVFQFILHCLAYIT